MLSTEISQATYKTYKTYDIKPGQPFIHAKLDWFTMMFQDFTFADVLKWLKMDLYVDEFMKNFTVRSSGFDDQFVFGYMGISVSTKQFGYFDEPDEAWFDQIFPKIRLDISGSGLDYLRGLGLNVDKVFRDRTALPCDPERCHITRCDFAYDFINMNSGFLDDFIFYCNHNATASGRLRLYQKATNVTYSIKTGSEKTIYVGSKNSEQMLRCYDKKLQYFDPDKGVWKKKSEYGMPDSWFRIELQTRKKKSMELVYGDGDASALLKYIYESFPFSEAAEGYRERKIAVFWSSFWDWERLHRIIKNDYFVQFAVTPKDRLANAFKRNIRTFMEAISVFPRAEIADWCLDYIKSLYDGTPSGNRRRDRLLSDFQALGYTPLGSDHGFTSDGSMLLFLLKFMGD